MIVRLHQGQSLVHRQSTGPADTAGPLPPSHVAAYRRNIHGDTALSVARDPVYVLPLAFLLRSLAGLGPGQALVVHDHLYHLLLNAQIRVKRGHRILKDHGDFFATSLVQLRHVHL